MNKLAQALDKNREVSQHETAYRLLGLPMIRSSVKVKYLNTSHPNRRDGLLKDVTKLEDNESPFHNNAFTYYEHRPVHMIEGEYEVWNPHIFLPNDVSDNARRCTVDNAFHIQSWDEMCLADFW